MKSKHLRLGGAIVGLAAVAGFATLGAHAADVVAFSCAPGASITGTGSSFQNAGVQQEITSYASLCNGGVADVTYNSTGSGTGISSFTARTVQFGGTDVPYNDQQWALMQAGSGTNASHVETIPVALGAVGVANNEGSCVPANTQLSGATIAGIYAGSIKTWAQAVPGCPADPIIALHRSGNSGTTTAFKTYLTKKDPTEYAAGCNGGSCYKDPTPNWPGGGTACAGANTNQNMVSCLQNTTTYPHAIAYIDESDAASSGVSVAEVDNAAGTFIAPGAGVCTEAATVNATPNSTSVDWSQVDITDGPNGYGICTYTYQLAFDTPVTAGAASAAQAQIIANFISYEVSGAGQTVFSQHGYDPLPTQVQALAQVAAHTLLTNN